MNKKMFLLCLLPGLGTLILWIYLFVEMIKGKFSEKLEKYFLFLGLCDFVILLAFVSLTFGINILFPMPIYLINNIEYIWYVVGGYTINLLNFYFINKKYFQINNFN